MSAASGSHGHDEELVHGHHDDGVPHATLKGYLTGFILSVILTVIPFWMVMTKALASNDATTYIILALAVVQIFVHVIYFLHMNSSSEHGWNMLALIFTMVIVVIALAGSLWVMYHMHVNMVPMTPQAARAMP
jgi:cytochrome o ubiquinol oxidase operon protein cyoD